MILKQIILLFLFAQTFLTQNTKSTQCQPITIPICSKIGYNQTFFPNQFHHQSQPEASAQLNDFIPLIASQCSDDLTLLLCSLFTPICIVQNVKLPNNKNEIILGKF